MQEYFRLMKNLKHFLPFVLMQEFLSSEFLFGSWARHWQLAMGTFIVLMVLLLPNGLAGLLNRLGRTAAGKEKQ